MSVRYRYRGFTLIELMVVVFIIAILENFMFKNPGPAISISEKLLISFKNNCLISLAKFLGLSLFALPKTIAALQDKSKLK